MKKYQFEFQDSKPKHWRNAGRIDLGVNVVQTISDKSMIHYPQVKKRNVLPKLNVSQEVKLTNIRTMDALPEIKEEEEVIDNEWIQLQQRTIENMVVKHDIGEWITITVGQGKKRLPMSIVKESVTLMHLIECGKRFREGVEGLSLPSVPGHVFDYIQEYLFRQYLIKRKIDTSMFRTFEIPFFYALDVIDSALYLDFSGLVEIACKTIASQISQVDQLDSLPEPIVKNILKMVNIGELIVVENRYAPNRLDTTTVWIDKLWKVLGHSKEPIPHFLQNDSLVSIAKQVCVEFYTCQIIQKVTKELLGKNNLLSQVVTLQGARLLTLDVNLDYGSYGMDTGFWGTLFSKTVNLKTLKIHCKNVNPSISHLLSSMSKNNLTARLILFLYIPMMAKTVWEELHPLFYIPKLSSPKPHSKAETARYVRMQTETKFKLNGISSLAEYMDKPIQKQEKIQQMYFQKTAPIELQVIEEARVQHKHHPLKILSSEFFIPHISILNLENVKLGLAGALELASICSNNTATLALSQLNISNTMIGSKGLIHILEAISSNKFLCDSLSLFSLSRIITETDNDHLEAIKALSQLIESTNLKILNISNNYIQSVGLKMFFGGIQKSKINNLDISDIPISTCIHALSLWTKQHPQITLRVSKCGLIPRTFAVFFQSISSRITTLDISNNALDTQAFKELGNWLKESQVEELFLSGIFNVPFDLITRAKNLKRVYLHSCGIDDEFMECIADGIGSSRIQFWSLKDNEITDKGFQILRKAITSIKKTIKFDLQGNRISQRTMDSYYSRTQRYGLEGIMAFFGSQK